MLISELTPPGSGDNQIDILKSFDSSVLFNNYNLCEEFTVSFLIHQTLLDERSQQEFQIICIR